MKDRNLTSNAYDVETAKEIENQIRKKHIKLFEDLHSALWKKYNEN
ncbi:MAG: hypothetical protein KDD00_03705 [Ignavibacteriae bacterium]|nr:hypothetical protein [Ignavibacteriota bacterium]